MYIACPKCQGWARYRVQDRDVVLRCICGYLAVVASTLEDGIVIEHTELKENVTLPRKGSKLHMCLVELAGLKMASTLEITQAVNRFFGMALSTSEVASHMTILRYKGLVFVFSERKGVSGGSTWKLTKEACELI